VEQVFGLMRGADMMVGFPSGLSIMSAVLRAKTLMIWNHFYDKNFAWYCCPPETRGTNYHIVDTKQLTVDDLVNKAMAILEGDEKLIIQEKPPVKPIPIKKETIKPAPPSAKTKTPTVVWWKE
jgi:hypothetical protein